MTQQVPNNPTTDAQKQSQGSSNASPPHPFKTWPTAAPISLKTELKKLAVEMQLRYAESVEIAQSIVEFEQAQER